MIIRSQLKEIPICGLSPFFTAKAVKMAPGGHVIQMIYTVIPKEYGEQPDVPIWRQWVSPYPAADPFLSAGISRSAL